MAQDTAPYHHRQSYAEAMKAFSVEKLAKTFAGDFEKGINACVECCDRHAQSAGVALRWISQDGRSGALTFKDLQEQSARFANVLADQGVKPGDVVAGLLPRIPELLTVVMGVWRAGAIYQPLFTAFGPKAIDHRVTMSGAQLIVTDPANRPKLDDLAHRPKIAVIARSEKGEKAPAGDIDFFDALAKAPATFEPVMRTGDDGLMMMSTSGTTGLAKGVPVPIKALMGFRVYMEDGVDLRPDDRYWNIADPGWAYGLYYAVTGPLLLGCATTFYDGPFTVDSTYKIIDENNISNLAGSPTAYRLLIAAGAETAQRIKGKLRVVSSAGEPLNPEVIRWFAQTLNVPIHDHYGQTELGMVVNNHHRLEHAVHPGSAGLAMAGHRVVALDADNRELGPHHPGELSVDLKQSPLCWFRGYYKAETPAISGGYYRSGDLVELEPDGAFSFVGRNDDVITSSGYRIGPFDVESALIEHPAVVEAAVIGKPDAERTEIVKAFVVLHPDHPPSAALEEELRNYVRQRLSAHAYPREIAFLRELPKTPSGKLQRFILRNQEKATAGS